MQKPILLNKPDFLKRIEDHWDQWDTFAITDALKPLGGTVLPFKAFDMGDYSVYAFVIQKPTHLPEDLTWITELWDAGNHCISSGAATLEDDTLYIIWSNKGHI